MTEIPITDSVHALVNIGISDQSPLSLSKLTHLNFSSLPLVGDAGKPIDKCAFEQVGFGVKLSSPAMLLGAASKFTVSSAESGTLSIRRPARTTVFPGDGFAPVIPIQKDECWVGLELQTSLTGTLASAASGFGVEIKGSTAVAFGTYVALKSAAGVLPTLREGLKTALESYSVVRDAETLRKLPIGTVHTAEMAGTVSVAGSYGLPIGVTPLASAGLPLNFRLNVSPELTLKATGEIALKGDFIVRFYRRGETELIFGVFKKRDTTFKVEFKAAAGIGAGPDKTDVVGDFLKAVFPGTDVAVAGFSEERAGELRAALKDCVDYSLATSLNTTCTASKVDESAIVYAIDLAAGDKAATDAALNEALRGHWTGLDALPNAKAIRNVCREVHEKQHKLAIHLLGFYNASSIGDYIKSAAILRDENGRIFLIDKVKAGHLQIANMPYLAKDERLREALAEAFIATLTYAAAGSKLKLQSFRIQQTYDRYAASMPLGDVRHQVLLGRALHLIPAGDWGGDLAGNVRFNHARCSVTASYEADSTLQLFFADAAARTPFTQEYLERVGRQAKTALIDVNDDNSQIRLQVLADDALWKTLSDTANTSAFKSIPALRNVHETALGAISADWVDVRWWADSLLDVAPQLSRLWDAVAASTAADPTEDAKFMQSREALEDVLAKVAHNAKSAFGDGWGLLVMYLLSKGAAGLQMDLCWNGTFQHYASGARAAASRGTSG